MTDVFRRMEDGEPGHERVKHPHAHHRGDQGKGQRLGAQLHDGAHHGLAS